MLIKNYRYRIIIRIALLLVVLCLGIYPTDMAQAAGVISTCTEGDFNAALGGGGDVIFACSGTINITTVKPISANTVIDASGYDVILDGGGSSRIFSLATGINLTLRNLTIQNGYDTGAGGAILMDSGGALLIENSRFLNNTAGNNINYIGRGGAIFADVNPQPGSLTPASVKIVNSVFDNNQAFTTGGAIFIDGGENFEGTPTRVTAQLEISNSIFSNNSITDDGNGGAIYINLHTTFNAEGSLFRNNLAIDSGGAVYIANLTNPLILNDNQTNLVNNTFSGNTANSQLDGASGGAIFLGGNSNLVHNTFYNNTVGTIGSGRFGSAIFWPATGLTNISRDNIFTANTGSTYECMNGSTYAAYGSNNLTDDGSCNNSTMPNAVTNFDTILSNNGGPTFTHALLSTSNAIDSSSSCTYVTSGTNTLFSNGATIVRDQRGAARAFGTGCDKGAYEVREILNWGDCTADLSGSHDFGFASGRTVSIAINAANGLSCITVEEMGGAHLLGNPGIQMANTWWRISGNVNSGFNINLTLPASFVPNSGDLDCRYTGSSWDCSADSFSSTSITRNNISEFSDWATFEDQSPTAVSLLSFQGRGGFSLSSAIVIGLILSNSLVVLRKIIRKEEKFNENHS